ncbi:hypothetical protein ACFFK0_22265 [Paenibacillus chartarius]|uniref:Uncharacterized protein n=1 Tax=Paenibacillus chartarius TaxID=747481 RepID=A0ABV6DR67_9BACL
MEHLVLGRVGIAIRNEDARGEDIYRISGGWQDAEATRQLLGSLEEPERYAVDQEESGVHVYTKQPDAAVDLAMLLNRQQGVSVSEADAEQVREQLIRMQQGTQHSDPVPPQALQEH